MLSTGGEHDRSLHVIDGEFGKSKTISAAVTLAARYSRTSTTAMRVPTMQGLPALAHTR